MQIKNMQIKSIEARRYTERDNRPKKVRINHNSNISQIASTNKKQALIRFEYTASYGHVGLIKLEGSLIYTDDNAEEIAKNWKDSKKMPDEIASNIHTAIMHACVPQAVGLAKDLQLPPPIPLPQVKLGSNAKKGKAGPEVA